MFWDFYTRNFDGAVKPIPVLQVINLLCGITGLAFEWPVAFVAGSTLHRSIEFRIAMFSTFAMAAVLLYQATNSALYYLIGIGVYFWAYTEGEVSSIRPRKIREGSCADDDYAGDL